LCSITGGIPVFGTAKTVSFRQNHSTSVLLAAVLIFSGLVAMPLVGQATPSGITAGKYGAQSVFSVTASSPSCAGSDFTPVNLDLSSPVSLSSGEYLSLAEIAEETTYFVLRKFDSAGATITDVTDRASVLGANASGFVVRYETEPGPQQLFFSNFGPTEETGIDFTPTSDFSSCVEPDVISDKTQLQSYSAFAPTVTSVSPDSGSIDGGTEITIIGTGFVPTYTTVRVGGIEAVISEISSTQIIATTGARSSGSANVVVSVGPASSAQSIAFAYENPPIVLCEEVAKARSVFKDGNLFLGGSYIELGISPLGNFGTTTSKPAGFFATPSSSAVGMSVDYDGFNCGKSFPIDFFLPGSPEERFAAGFRFEADSPANHIGVSALEGIEGSALFDRNEANVEAATEITDLSAGTLLRALVVTTFSSTTGDPLLEVTQDISFEEDAMYFSNVVTLKNVSTSEMTSSRYMRSFDPDNTQYQGGSYETENTIVAQHHTDSFTAVRAQVTETNFPTDKLFLEFGTRAPIVFYSAAADTRAGAFGFSNSNPYHPSAYESAAATGYSIDDDAAITITMEYGGLAPAQQKSRTYITSLDLRDFSALSAELEVLAEVAQSRTEEEVAAPETVPGTSTGGFVIPPVVEEIPTAKPERKPRRPAPSVPTITSPSLVSPSPAPSPSLVPEGPIALLGAVEPTPGVRFLSPSDIPAALRVILSKPLAYEEGAAGGGLVLPALTPGTSLAYENGAPVEIRLVRTDEQNGYSLIGDGWRVDLAALDSNEAPLQLDDSGNIILNQDRFVQFSGTGFAPGSIIKVWLFSDPMEVSEVLADASGNFVGQAQLPEGIPTGEHTVQLNGLSQDGQLRSVSLGVLVQPDIAVAPVPLDLSGLMNGLLILAAGVLSVFFFILWRRRKKKEEEGEIPSSSVDNDNLIFASEGFEPNSQMPNDSRRKTGPAAPANRKRFTFKPKNT
jgi:hypothetical protein